MPAFYSRDKELIFRYLLWFYKVTKEALDRIDRQFTQLQVDHYVWQQLRKSKGQSAGLKKNLKAFREYIDKKEKSAQMAKFAGGSHKLNPEYQFLKSKLDVLEDAIVHFLGKKSLKEIKELYMSEMIQRILTARDH